MNGIYHNKPLPVILAVDDNLQNLQVIGSVISGNIPCDLRIAKSGIEALKLVEKAIPDLILLDVNMPEMDGYEVCRRIKSIEGLKDVPVIFITALGESESIVRGFEAGGSDYVVKPFDPLELTARARTHLELRLSRLELERINRDLAARNEKMEKDLKVAQMVMKGLISMKKPAVDGIEVDFRYMPLDRVGGDYFRFFPMPNGQCGLFLGDVTGHGVASALFLSLIKSVTDRIQSEKGNMPAEFMRLLNLELLGKMTSYFITGLYLYFSRKETGELQLAFANGGHPKPVLIRKGRASFIGDINTVVAVQERAEYHQNSMDLEKGDRLFIYTDGIPETRNSDDEIIGFTDQLLDLFLRSNKNLLGETLDAVISELVLYRGSSRAEDDITIVGFDIQ